LLATGALCGTATLAASAWNFRSDQRRIERSRTALGTRVSVVALHADEQFADQAISTAFDEIETVEAAMSIYRPGSQLSQLNRTGELAQPHPSLVQVLRHATATSRHTGGAFDVTVQPLWLLYADAHREERLPSDDEVAQVRQRVDWRRVEVTDQRIRLLGEGTAITLNGIAQGFAADVALAALKGHGIEHALIDAGELSPLGQNAERRPWQIGIQHPREPAAFAALAKLEGRCLATSGDYATKFSADARYNHIFDPRSGQSPDELASVSIAAPTAMQADALSTACFVLGPARASKLIESLDGVDALFILKTGRTLSTAGFPFATEEGAA
jgi:thiamine biosynthesis lipoprotein